MLPDHLNTEQLAIYRHVTRRLANLHHCCNFDIVHIEARAGTGKTFLCNVIAAQERARRPDGVFCSAYTAKAAQHYPDGQTCHRLFQLSVTQVPEEPTSNLHYPNYGAFFFSVPYARSVLHPSLQLPLLPQARQKPRTHS